MMEIKNVYEADVLVVGGGVAGLMAAIAAAEKGARVLVAEKADSGAAVPARRAMIISAAIFPNATGRTWSASFTKCCTFAGGAMP